MLDPSGKFKMTWDFFFLFNLIFFAFFIPVCTVFKGNINQEDIFMYEHFNIIKTIFIIDLFLNLNTSIQNKGKIV